MAAIGCGDVSGRRVVGVIYRGNQSTESRCRSVVGFVLCAPDIRARKIRGAAGVADSIVNADVRARGCRCRIDARIVLNRRPPSGSCGVCRSYDEWICGVCRSDAVNGTAQFPVTKTLAESVFYIAEGTSLLMADVAAYFYGNAGCIRGFHN